MIFRFISFSVIDATLKMLQIDKRIVKSHNTISQVRSKNKNQGKVFLFSSSSISSGWKTLSRDLFPYFDRKKYTLFLHYFPDEENLQKL